MERNGTISLKPQLQGSEGRSMLRQDWRAVVKKILGFCIALSCAAVVSLSAVAGETSPRVRHHARHAPHHVSGPVAPTPTGQAPNEAAASPGLPWITSLFPNVKPYPPGQGDTDGLSRNTDDCNKGCIDNPIR
jgi:hypothetical protein